MIVPNAKEKWAMYNKIYSISLVHRVDQRKESKNSKWYEIVFVWFVFCFIFYKIKIKNWCVTFAFLWTKKKKKRIVFETFLIWFQCTALFLFSEIVLNDSSIFWLWCWNFPRLFHWSSSLLSLEIAILSQASIAIDMLQTPKYISYSFIEHIFIDHLHVPEICVI